MMTVFNHHQNKLLAPSIVKKYAKKSLSITGLGVLIVSLTACNTIPSSQNGPVVAQPNIPISGNYDAYLENAKLPISTSMAALRWQSYYTEPKLQSLIALGLDNNKDIKQALMAIRKARAQYQITDNQDLPTLNGSADYTLSANNAINRNPSNGYSVGLGLANYELDFWGRVAGLKDQALDNFLATKAAKDTAQVSLIASIAKSYIALSYQLKQLELAELTLETRLESLRINKARLDAGIDSKAPTLQAEASVETARIAMLNAETRILKAKNALEYLIGIPIPEALLPSPAVPEIVTQDVLSIGVPSELLHYRPDVLQAEYELKAAGANIDVARAAYFPSISLTGRLGYSSDDLKDLFKSSAAGWSFGPSISVPIFDAGLLDSNYEIAEIEREQTLLNYERTIETSFREVSDVLADKATLNSRLKAQYRLQDSYNELYDIAEARYNAQVDDYLKVLDAQRALFSTQQSILNLEQQRLDNEIELYQALGGGVNLEDPIAIPIPSHTNLANILTPDSNKQEAIDALAAASSPSTISLSEAKLIKSQQPMIIATTEVIDRVDLNADSTADTVVIAITKKVVNPVTPILAPIAVPEDPNIKPSKTITPDIELDSAP